MIIKREAELLQSTINKPENQVCPPFELTESQMDSKLLLGMF